MPAKKNRTAKARATIVCLRNGKVLLVRKKGARWNLPGGVIEPGETPEEAAIRELREEASLHCQGLHALCTLPVGNVLHHIFTTNLGERTRPVPSNEIVACKWVLRSVLGRMQLSSTAAALLAKELPVLSAPV